MQDTQNRWRSKAAWASLLGLVGLLFSNYGLYNILGITGETWQALVNALLTALVAFGCAPTVGEQWAIAKGTVVESGTAAPIEGAFIVLAGYEIYSDAQGGFLIDRIPIPEDPVPCARS